MSAEENTAGVGGLFNSGPPLSPPAEAGTRQPTLPPNSANKNQANLSSILPPQQPQINKRIAEDQMQNNGNTTK